jgi:hypothetical protein
MVSVNFVHIGEVVMMVVAESTPMETITQKSLGFSSSADGKVCEKEKCREKNIFYL